IGAGVTFAQVFLQEDKTMSNKKKLQAQQKKKMKQLKQKKAAQAKLEERRNMTPEEKKEIERESNRTDFNASHGVQGRQNAQSPQASQAMHRPQGG
ncbi:MAG: hypothetical protein MK085_13225, partial [Phycisphaerales bacterium]|nr:hypothetical protein [Phycisphaerales bacterium]